LPINFTKNNFNGVLNSSSMNAIIKSIAVFLFNAVLVACAAKASAVESSPLQLWYDQPAKVWQTQALPIGNGRLAAMLFGGVHEEHIQFNEESLWIGDEQETGAYQPFGEVFVEFAQTNATHYRRELDLERAVHGVSYDSGGVNFRREAFASYPANVLVFRFTADKPGSLTGTITLTDAHKGKVTAEKNKFSSSGSLAGFIYHGGLAKKDQPPYAVALNYEAQVVVRNEGGATSVHDGKITFNGVNNLTIFLDAGTDFVQDRAKNWRGVLPHDAIKSRLAAAANTPYEKLLAEHVKDYQRLFDRVKLNFGVTEKTVAVLPTGERLAHYQLPDAKDAGLEELLFQYGRYLLIASSRPGCLPANLQGKWNNMLQPPWRCDYHTDINLEENYWPADAANLSECFEPYARWINSIRQVRAEATRKAFGVRGWAMRGESGLFGGSTWDWVLGTSAWLLQDSYEHYRFTGDKEYLRTLAYPAMKEVCEFWIDSLNPLPDGTLTTPTDLSPEHGPKEPGISFDLEWVWDLFTSTIEASKILGVDSEFRATLADKLAHLQPLKIGKWGQLQEWSVDRDDPKDHHRHVSHMVGLYPGREISPATTPALAEAAKVSLQARGDECNGWAIAWHISLWARLLDGEHAYKMVRQLLRPAGGAGISYSGGGGVYENLLDACPPFQIDGNFGYPAGVCEMLLQSQQNEIVLLPALPKAWAAQGSFTGLRARGNITVDCTWQDGKVTHYKLASPDPHPVVIRVNGETKTELPAKN
jgi:alpha-L-fucosidase 2